MSMVSASRTQRKEKSSSNIHKGAHASAEEIRLAQIISNPGLEEDGKMSKNVAQIVEITGTTEENARIALYDCNNDSTRAIDLILENSALEQSNEWETAGKKKNKPNQNAVRGVVPLEDDMKEEVTPHSENFDKSTHKGRGRGRSLKSRGKSSDPERQSTNNSKGSFESRDRYPRERRGRGRGLGRGGRRGGSGPVRRFGRYAQSRGDGYPNERPEDSRDEFPEKFGTFTNSATGNHTKTSEAWDTDEDWGALEVGTWSNDDTQKRTEKKSESGNEPWGSGSWKDDLVESQVFQSQNTQIPNSAPPPPNHGGTQGNAPQMGERIDLGTLFKKNTSDSGSNFEQVNSDSLIGQSGIVFNNSAPTQHSAPSVIQQLQQQGQSNSLFSDTKLNEMESKSRLFGAYERQNNPNTSNNSTDIGTYSSRTTESSYPQYSDNLMAEADNNNSLLGTLNDQFKANEQSLRLGQMTELSKSPYTSLTQADPQIPVSTSGYHNFSQAQQREATEAVKASLGLPASSGEQLQSSGQQAASGGINQNENMALSFGAPHSGRMKQQRKKMSTLSSKIPASAVEMPGAGGGSYHELSNFDLQFGIDDSLPTIASNVNGPMVDGGMQSTQAPLYNANSISLPASLINHMTSGNLEDTSIFTSQLPPQNQQTRAQVESNVKTSDSSISVNSQRYPDSLKSSESTLRGPPGIAHPQSLPSATSSGTSLGVLPTTTQQSPDLSSSGSYGSSRMPSSGNMSMGGLTHDSAKDSSQSVDNQMHSYYSQSINQQSQHMAQEHTSSTGRSLRSPAPTSQITHSVTPSKDVGNTASTAMSSLSSGLVQTHITPHGGGTPTKSTSSSAPISILGSSDSGSALGSSSGYGTMNIGYSTSSGTSVSSQSATPVAASPGKHLTNNDLYTSTGLSSSIHHNHQTPSSSSMSSSSLSTALGSSVLSLSNTGTTKSSSQTSTASKSGPPNLPLGVPPILPNQFGFPMGPGLMTAYTPEALYGYTDPLVAVQSRVHQVPNYYDMYNSNNPSNTSSINRDSNTTSSSQGKFGRGEPSSPTSLIGVVNSGGATNLAQQQLAAGQHGTQLKVTQSGAHQAQPFVNLPTATPAYAGYSGLYYNAFQYPPMFAAAATAVPSAKHQGNTTAAYQQPAAAFANAYSTSSINASSASSLHDLQGQGYGKSHVQAAYDKQTFHHHTNTPPPFNIQTLTAAMAAANPGGAAGAAPGMNPYTQAPFMTVLPTHQHSQIHVHLPQHGDAGQSVGSQRSQDSNPLAKSASKGPFGNAGTQYWGN